MQLTNKQISEILSNSRIENVLNKQWPIRIGFLFALSIDKLKKHHEVYNQERLKVIGRYAKTKDDGTIETEDNGRVLFNCLEDAVRCEQAVAELDAVPVEIDITPIEVSFNDFPNDVTPNDILPLLALIRIKEESNGDNPV